jgi:hypothetical protein
MDGKQVYSGDDMHIYDPTGKYLVTPEYEEDVPDATQATAAAAAVNGSDATESSTAQKQQQQPPQQQQRKVQSMGK